MTSLTIRNLDNALKARLRLRAARHGRSMEAEVRAILAENLSQVESGGELAAAIHRRFAPFALEALPLPPRQAARTPPDFGG